MSPCGKALKRSSGTQWPLWTDSDLWQNVGVEREQIGALRGAAIVFSTPTRLKSLPLISTFCSIRSAILTPWQTPSLRRFFAATGSQIDRTEVPRGYCNLKTGSIHMPLFASLQRAAGYCASLAHEVSHWAEAAHRLDRFNRFNVRKLYAFEELVAEIGNCMLCALLGLEPEFDQSTADVEGWLKALNEENRVIFRAASEAQKAVDYIMAYFTQVDRMVAE